LTRPRALWYGWVLRGTLRTGVVITAAITAGVVLYVMATRPRPAIALDGRPPATHVVGAYHIHSTRSDGTGTPDAIALAASRAGLQFIILTDHGDGTRPPDPPAYRHGVLVIDAVEVNTREGHVVALGLNTASPYPLAGPAQDVIEDIHRQGGVAILAHPDSPREALSWRGGQGIAADGVEWLNVDSEWRDESAPALLRAAAHALTRPTEAIASMFSRPVRSLQRWDSSARVRPTVGLAAVDAHASIPWREQEEPRQSAGFEWPSYETMFRTVVQTVILERPLSGTAADDADELHRAMVGGQTYSTVRAQAWPSTLHFSAERGETTFRMGERLAEAPDPVTFTVNVPQAPGSQITLLRNGQPHRTGQGTLVVTGVLTPGVYRVEVQLPSTTVPWIVSNPITLEGEDGAGPAGGRGGGRGARGDGPGNQAGVVQPVRIDSASEAWTIEHDTSSEGTVAVEADGRLRFDYHLGSGAARGQYAAVVYGPDPEDGIETVSFVAAASAPMRVSVQVRLPEGRGRVAQRWRRSIYLDETPASFLLRLQDFEPADRPTVRRPIVTPIQSLLVVVDTVNARAGAAGTVWLSDVTLGVNRLE